jgi:uncharacterized protein (DUF1778 family)
MLEHVFRDKLDLLMDDQSQISATVSAATKEKLDGFAKSRGLNESYVVEQALLYFMAARQNLPNEAIVPVRLVLNDEACDELVDQLERSPTPRAALRKLMR